MERRWVDNRVSRAFVQFFRAEAAGGVVMLTATALALVLANSPLVDSYKALWKVYAGLRLGDWGLELSLLHWINDGLMAVFFFLVGLEIKREILFGELASVRRAALPILGAVGGAAVPALLFLAFTGGGEYARGWGIPMATDIAFAVTILALLGSRAPLWLTSFVTALAIADDIMAVLVIALFYTSGLDVGALVWAGGFAAALLALNRLDVQHPAPYLAAALMLWFVVLQSGVHATIAGVAAAAFIPASRRRPGREAEDMSSSLTLYLESLRPTLNSEAARRAVDEREFALEELADDAHASSALLYRLEHGVHPWVAFFVLPVFAFANAGVPIPLETLSRAVTHPLTLGIAVGLFVGKQVGITGITWIAVRAGIGELAAGASWRQLWGGAALAGIGFTMSIFIASLAFLDASTLELAKVGIILGSLASAVVGVILLRLGPPPAEPSVRED